RRGSATPGNGVCSTRFVPAGSPFLGTVTGARSRPEPTRGRRKLRAGTLGDPARPNATEQGAAADLARRSVRCVDRRPFLRGRAGAAGGRLAGDSGSK